mgnify:CR=1 FL=1
MSQFTDEKLKNFDAVIATGSNNAARYFDYYFSKFPSLIRKNRNGVAVLNGKETKTELESLGRDMLQYYGLGCRSVAKLYLPNGYDLNKIFGGIYPFSCLIDVNKYANNYDYNKAVFLMSEFDFTDNGFFILKEDTAISSPIACAFYEHYDDATQLRDHIKNKNEFERILVVFKAHNIGYFLYYGCWDSQDSLHQVTKIPSDSTDSLRIMKDPCA